MPNYETKGENLRESVLTDEELERRRRARRTRQKEERRRRALRRYRIRMAVLGVAALLVLVLVFLLLRGAFRLGKSLLFGEGKKTLLQASVTEEDLDISSESIGADSGRERGERDSELSDGEPADPEDGNGSESSLSAQGEKTVKGSGEPLAVSAGAIAYSGDSAAFMGSDEMTSTYGILVNADTGKVIAAKNAYDRMYPASMTKILTVLVAAEHIADLKDTFTMNLEITDYAYTHDCSYVGFKDGEAVTVEDLFYGTILQSGGDAALGLAYYVAGSQEAFVELMNDKLQELGIGDTAHVTNCIGIYDDNHYCRTYDMAVILGAAMKSDFLRKLLGTRTYTTSSTAQNPGGITISNWFMRRVEDKDCGGEVLGAKTGYVVKSGNCAASFFKTGDGTEFICVTGDAHSSWRAIYDHVAVYNIYAAGNTGYHKS